MKIIFIQEVKKTGKTKRRIGEEVVEATVNYGLHEEVTVTVNSRSRTIEIKRKWI